MSIVCSWVGQRAIYPYGADIEGGDVEPVQSSQGERLQGDDVLTDLAAAEVKFCGHILR